MNSAGLNVEQARQVALRADATYAGGRVTIRQAVVEWRGQTILAEGTLGVAGPTKPIDLRVRVVDTQLTTLLPAFNLAVPAEGVLSGTVHIGGTLENPSAEAALTGRDLAAYGEPLGSLAVDATLAGRVVRVTRLRLEKPAPGGTLTAAGFYNLDTQAYSFDARTDNFELRQFVLPNGMAVRGEVDLVASGSGTVRDPSGGGEGRDSGPHRRRQGDRRRHGHSQRGAAGGRGPGGGGALQRRRLGAHRRYRPLSDHL